MEIWRDGGGGTTKWFWKRVMAIVVSGQRLVLVY